MKKNRFFKIGSRKIGENFPAFIIAELSCNHNQNFETALKSIRAIAKTGADAVKLQTCNPELITLNLRKKNFLFTGDEIWKNKTIFELEKKTFLPKEWHKPLFKEAKKHGLICFSSPFDVQSVRFLRKLKVPAFKVASMEISDNELIAEMAKTGKPIIISTGVANERDIRDAIKICKKFSNNKVAILKCTSSYPTSLKDVNLNNLLTFKKFKTILGLSDHTISTLIPAAAVTMGAKIIEKHFKLNNKIKTFDSSFSLNPIQFRKMVNNIRNVEKAMGNFEIKITKSMSSGRKLMRSLYFVQDVKKNEIISRKNIRSIRPNGGLHPKFLNKLLGKKVKKNVKIGSPVAWNLLKK